MMDIKKVVVGGLLLVLIVVSGINWFINKPLKVCYVRNQYLVENFLGMKEAQKDFDEKFKLQRSYLDSLQLVYKTLEMKFRSSSPEERKKLIERVKDIQNQISEYSNYYRNITGDEDKRMTEQVLNQVNSYVKEYGESNKYDIIIGSTSTGNILYGKKDLDITEDLLKGINQLYKGDK